MTELYGIDYLQSQLALKSGINYRRYMYYDMKNITKDFDISTPPNLRWFDSKLGWCGTAVDALADRLQFKEFKNDTFNLNEIIMMNNPDVLFDDAIRSALIIGCSFIYISNDENGFPRLQVINGQDATGILDPITNMLTEGYAVLERDQNGNVIMDAYFTKGRTEIRYITGESDVFEYNCNYCMLVPIIYRKSSKAPFGRSRISKSCMSLQDSACRTLKRSEIAAEYYSYPQKYALGISDDLEMDKWKASMSSMLTISKDEDGDKPTVGQFQQQSMTPHTEQLKMFAALFAGETGLTLDDLGFPSANPSSSDAIKAAHESLRLIAKKAQRNFASGFLNVGIVAASIRDDFAYERKAFYETVASWYPVFEPDGSSLSGTGDAFLKLQHAFPDYIDEEKFADITGV